MADMKEVLSTWDAADELLAHKIEKCVTKDEWTTIKKSFTQTAANTLEYTGITIEVPLGKVALITVINQYNNSKPVKVALVRGGTTSDNISDFCISNGSVSSQEYITDQYLKDNNYATVDYVDTKIQALQQSIDDDVKQYISTVVDEQMGNVLDEKIEAKINDAIEPVESTDINSLFN